MKKTVKSRYANGIKLDENGHDCTCQECPGIKQISSSLRRRYRAAYQADIKHRRKYWAVLREVIAKAGDLHTMRTCDWLEEGLDKS